MSRPDARALRRRAPLLAALGLLAACTNTAPPAPTPLSLTSLSPTSGAAGTTVTVRGAGIAGDADVELCGVAGLGATVLDASGGTVAVDGAGVRVRFDVPDLGTDLATCDVVVRSGGEVATLAAAFAYTPDPVPGAGTWTTLAPAPAARQEVSFVALHGRLYLTGGSDRMEAYVPEDDAWTLLTPFPGATTLDHMQAVALRGKLYFLGGLDAFQWPQEVGSAYAFDPTAEPALGAAPGSDPWTALAPMGARGRGAGGVVAFEGQLYYAGGLRGGAAVDWFDVYDPVADAWSPLPPMPRARDHFHAAVVDRKLYAIGGRAFEFDANLPDVDVYDFDTGTWSTLPTDLPTPRGGFAVAVLGREILVIGGEGRVDGVDRAFATVEAYDTVAGTWRTLADLPTARHGIQAAVCDGAVYVAAGGAILGGGAPTAVLERFHLGDTDPGPCATPTAAPVSIDWDTVAAVPSVHAEAQGIAVGERMYLLGGFVSNWGAYTYGQEVHVYDTGDGTWTNLTGTAPLPAPWTHAASVRDGDRVHLLGGRLQLTAGDDVGYATTDVWTFDTTTETWHVNLLPPVPVARSSSGAVILDGWLHSFGGIDGDVDENANLDGAQESAEHWALDLADPDAGWVRLADLPNPRNHIGYAVVDGGIHVLGGQYDSAHNLDPQTSHQRYDPVADAWTELAPLPATLSHISTSTLAFHDRLLVVGGERFHNAPVPEVLLYDPATDAWRFLDPLPHERRAAVAVDVDGVLYVASGDFQTQTYRGVVGYE